MKGGEIIISEAKNEKLKKKESNLINKFKLRQNSQFVTAKSLKRKMGNSQIFLNLKAINDNGIIELKTNQYAVFYKVNPIDLSLTSDNEQRIFFHTLSKLYRLPYVIKAYKFDEKINLNINKENYENLINENYNNEARRDLLINNYGFIDSIETENLTSASSYYFAIICNNKESLDKAREDFERICSEVVPKLDIEFIDNKKILVKIFSNLYYANINLDQIMYYDFMDLLSPVKISELPSYLKIDDQEVQMVSIKNYPLFVENGFLDRIINLPNVKASITIKDTIEQSKLLNVLNSSFKAVLADYNSSKNLSDVTEMQNLMSNYKMLIEQISANDEKIKEVSIILAISGTKKEREEIIKEIKANADLFQIKVDVPMLRQMEAWQGFELTDKGLPSYAMYLPTLTLGATFFFTENYHNDKTGWFIGEDCSYRLPTFFDLFTLSKNRTGHNMSVIGTTGSGKSFFLKLLITQEFARGTKLFLFDMENELEKLTNRCGGEYIDLSNKSLINPLQVRYISSDDEDETSILGKHLGFLENFFTTAFENISEKELVVLLDIIEKFYNTRGITKQTTIEEFEKMTPKDYPIFSDLYAYLLEQQKQVKNAELQKILVNIEILLKRLVTGQDGNLYNGITTIDLSNDLITFNLQGLSNTNKRLVNTQMINLLTYLNNVIVDNKKKNDKTNKKQNILFVVDEFHCFVDEDNPTLLKYFGEMSRRLRKYSAGIVVATQQPSDLTSSSGILRYASNLFGVCQYKATGLLDDRAVQDVEKIYANEPLTETQKKFLITCTQGYFLINITNKNRIRVHVLATPLQLYYMGESDDYPYGTSD